MGIFIAWVFFALCVGFFATNRGRGSGNWFVISLVFSPLLGLIILALLPNLENKAPVADGPTEKTHVKCIKCAEFVMPEASVCKHCGAELTPDSGYVMRIHRQDLVAKDEEQQNTVIGWSIIIGIGVVIWLIAKYT